MSAESPLTEQRASGFPARWRRLLPALLLCGAVWLSLFGSLFAGDVTERSGDMFRKMGGGFRQKQVSFNPAELIIWVLVIAGAFYGLSLLGRYMARREKRSVYHSPRALFRSLCRVHQLDAPACRLLRQLAASHRLSSAAEIFVRPDCFERSTLLGSLAEQSLAVEALAARLFRPRIVEAPPEQQPRETAALAGNVVTDAELLRMSGQSTQDRYASGENRSKPGGASPPAADFMLLARGIQDAADSSAFAQGPDSD